MFNAAKDRRERLIAMHSAISPYTPRGGNVRPTCDGYAHYPLAQWRNGQWADPMLAHAGTEAVRLVPLFQLAVIGRVCVS